MLPLGRFALVALTLAFSLAGCGEAQGTVPGVPVSDTGRAKGHGQSWMLPGASSEDLLYVKAENKGFVYAYSYPDLNLVGQLAGLTESPTGLCVDKRGDVFVTEEGNTSKDHGSYIVEFAHGGTDPIATLNDSDWPWSCSVDPTTGNLAVTNWVDDSVAIYAKAQGNPTYIATQVRQSYWAAYDNDGDLFVSGTTGPSQYSLVELPSGGSNFTDVSLNKSIGLDALQWNDGHLVTSFRSTSDTMLDLYRIQISGSKGKLVGTTVLNERKKLQRDYGTGQFLILGHSVLAAGSPFNCLQLWHYPSGGRVRKTLIKHLEPWAIGLSVAQSKK